MVVHTSFLLQKIEKAYITLLNQSFEVRLTKERNIFIPFVISRRKRYTLYDRIDNQMPIDQDKLVFHSIREIDIYSEKSIINCTNPFPNATELHFKNGFNTCSTSLEVSLGRIIHREQINKLVIECHRFSLKKMIDLLYYLPNIQTLIFESMPLYKDDLVQLEQSKPFRSVSEINHIKHVTFHDLKCNIFQYIHLIGQ